MQHLFPKVYSVCDNTITMENIDGVSFSHLLNTEQLKTSDIDLLLSSMKKLHEISWNGTRQLDMYSVYAQNLKLDIHKINNYMKNLN